MKILPSLGLTSAAMMLLPVVSGCASIGVGYSGEAAYNAAFREKIVDVTKLNAEELDKLQHVQLVESGQAIEGAPKGEVVGLACKLTAALFVFKWVWKPELNEANGRTPEDAARTQLRIKAMLIGANTVVAPNCSHKDGIDWGNNCFESWRCTARTYSMPDRQLVSP
jgi:hypothetical protein